MHFPPQFVRLLLAASLLVVAVSSSAHAVEAYCTWGSVGASSHDQDEAPSEVELLLRAGSLIDQIPSESTRSALRRRLETAAANQDKKERLKDLAAIVTELERAVKPATPTASGKSPTEEDVELEAEALNLITVYLFALRDLEGQGFLLVKRELTDNIKLSGVSEATQRLYRRLLDACNEAEASLRQSRYIDEDRNKSIGREFGEAVGAGSAVSLALGDPTPLFLGLVNATQISMERADEASRARELIQHRFEERLSTIAFEANSRRSDFLSGARSDPSLFLTQSTYESFRDALRATDSLSKRAALERVVRDCPRFREPYLYLAELLHDGGDADSAYKLLAPVADRASRILQREGVRARMYERLALISWLGKENIRGEMQATNALSFDSDSMNALMIRARLRVDLGKMAEAVADAQACVRAHPNSARARWGSAQVLTLAGKPDEVVLDYVEAALSRGYYFNTEALDNTPLKRVLATERGKFLTKPILAASYVPGIFDDDIKLRNTSGFPLSSVLGTGRVSYSVNGEQKEAYFSFSKTWLDAEGELVCANVFSMPAESQCTVFLKFTCDQSAREMESVWYYNHDGGRFTSSKSMVLNNLAWKVYLEDDRTQLRKAIAYAEIACKETGFQEPAYLDTLAHLCCMDGNRKRAVEVQEKAIAILERRESRDADTYRKTLEGFKAGRCR